MAEAAVALAVQRASDRVRVFGFPWLPGQEIDSGH
jgi:hypothetical protein